MTITYVDALTSLRPGEQWAWRGEDYSGLEWLDTTPKPSEVEITNKKIELENAEPMRLLRIERDSLLAQTDFYALSDVSLSDSMKTYRQELRGLPASASPQIDSIGNLTNVTWPTQPLS